MMLNNERKTALLRHIYRSHKRGLLKKKQKNTTMTKKVLSFAFFVLLAIATHAQYFEWARTIDGYDQSSSNVGNKIAGSMTDSDGDLYICAQYGWGASLCGVNLPDRGENGNMVVAKISPDGEMVWHKEIYGDHSECQWHSAYIYFDSGLGTRQPAPRAIPTPVGRK